MAAKAKPTPAEAKVETPPSPSPTPDPPSPLGSDGHGPGFSPTENPLSEEMRPVDAAVKSQPPPFDRSPAAEAYAKTVARPLAIACDLTGMPLSDEERDDFTDAFRAVAEKRGLSMKNAEEWNLAAVTLEITGRRALYMLATAAQEAEERPDGDSRSSGEKGERKVERPAPSRNLGALEIPDV